VLTQASALALLAAALLSWPRPFAVVQLERALADGGDTFRDSEGVVSWTLPSWPRSRWRRGLVVAAAIGGLAQFWPLAVAVVVVAVGATAARALLRSRRERNVVREEQAAVEGLGVLVAELRAGRSPDVALAAAGRHCGHPLVGDVLHRLGRSLRLGDQWAAHPDPDRSTWQVRLIAGVRLSQGTGCALADVAAAVESDLVRRGRQRADLRATAAGHRATVALLAGLPILGLAMGSGIGAQPVSILTTTVIGQVLLLAGVSLELLGLAWSRRLTDRALREG